MERLHVHRQARDQGRAGGRIGLHQEDQPILSLLPDSRIKVRFFVPEAQLSAYRVGGTVRFGCDGCAKGLTAKIAYIAPRPEFTPPVIYSREARDRLVYLVEAQPSARLNPGQPVDVEPLK